MAPETGHSRKYDSVVLGVGAAGLIALTFFLEQLVSPFLILFALLFILVPLREYRAAQIMLWTAGALFSLWLFATLSGILIPFIAGAVIAYLFNPLVTLLDRKYHISRGWSSIIIVLSALGLFFVLGWIFFPPLAAETSGLITRLSKFLTISVNNLDARHIRRFMLRLGFPVTMVDQIIVTEVTPQLKTLFSSVPKLVYGLIGAIPTVLEQALNLIIVPFAAFYILKDWPYIWRFFFEVMPTKDPEKLRHVAGNVDKVLYSYIRGQATVALIIGTLGGIAFAIIGIPYAALLGLILAIADLIPIAGLLFSVIIVEVVIVLTMEVNPGVVLSGFLVIGGLHALEAYVIGPRIVGRGIGLPPILMILSLAVFGYFLGFLGLLIAVPTTGVLMLFLREYRGHRRHALEEAIMEAAEA